MSGVMSRRAQPPHQRQLQRTVLGVVLALSGWMNAQAQAVRCHVHYGGEDQVFTAHPSAQPERVPATPVGSYFMVRIVNTLADPRQPAVKVFVYANHDSGPAPIHVAAYRPHQVRQRAASGGFTGLQQVYEPVRDGELAYWCERAPASAGQPSRPHSLTPSMVPDGALPRTTSAYQSATSVPAPPGVVRLVIAGDVMLADGPGQTVAQGGDPLAAFDTALRSGDYALGNLELPIASVGKPLENKIFSFRGDPQVMRVLKGRFDAMSVANNHSGDYGQPAFLETLDHLKQANIQAVGGGRNLEDAHRPLWIERNGLRIAVLAYNEFKPRSFQAGPDWPGVAWSEDDRVVADIRAARQAGADVVIPYMHWGWEREREPTHRQRTLARLMIDAGADVVVGGHPHVTQGVERYRGKLIVYSLGNFVFDSFEDVPGGQTGWLLRLTLDRHGLVNWDTLTAQMDLSGTPHPVPGAWSPCGQAQQPERQSLRGAQTRGSAADSRQRRTVTVASCAPSLP